MLDVKQLGKVAKALRRHQDKVMRLLAASTTATPQSIAAQLRDELARVQGRLAHLQQQADLLMVAEHQQQQQQLIQHAPLAVTPASASTTTTAAAAAPPRSLPASPLAARDLLSAAPAGHTTVLVCQGKACANKRAVEVLRAAGGAAADGAPEDVSILPCKCLGMCKAGPVMMVSGHAHEGSKVSTNYTHVGVADVPLVLEHVRGARQQQQPAPHGPVSPARRSVRASSLALHPQVDGATVA